MPYGYRVWGTAIVNLYLKFPRNFICWVHLIEILNKNTNLLDSVFPFELSYHWKGKPSMSAGGKLNNLVKCSECGILCEPVYVRKPIYLCYFCSIEHGYSKKQEGKVNIGGLEFDVLPDPSFFIEPSTSLGGRQMNILNFAKETEHKVRWDARVGDATFELYIPKWRVPEPCPKKIFVEVYNEIERHKSYKPSTPLTVEKNPNELAQPILAVVEWVADLSKTAHYKPIGNLKDKWEIGEPYIPFSLLPKQSSDPLLIEVRWDS